MKHLLAALLVPVAMLTAPCGVLAEETGAGRSARLRVAAFLMPPLVEGTTIAPTGPFLEYLKRLETLSGVGMDVTVFDSPRTAAEAMASGRFDAVAPAVRTPERERYLAFGEPLARLPVAILSTRPEVRQAATLADLAGKRVAVAIASHIDSTMARVQPDARYLRLSSAEEVLTGLALGQADYAVLELAHATRLAARLGLSSLHVVGRTPFDYEPVVGVLHSTSSDLKAALLSATVRMSPSEREQLLHGWLSAQEMDWHVAGGRHGPIELAMGSALLLAAAYGYHRHRLRRQVAAHELRDVTERREAEERIRHLACHDPLTDLPNRAALTQRLQAAIARARATGRALALCCLDADSFKQVNDSRGHAAGDATLRAVAARLRERCAPGAFIARLGGDEFVALHEDLGSESQAHEAAETLARLFLEPLAVDGESVYLTVSVGVALYPQDAQTADALLAATDTAMYAAKTAGRNTWRRFSGEMSLSLQQRADALQQLRQAYEQRRLLLHYQPKIELVSGRCIGVEALLRVQTEQGIRGPAGLIEAAEESGFISTLGDWVIETAAAQSRAWRREGIALPIAVNVSTRQLQDPRFVTWMQAQVRHDPALPALLDLEITESALASDARAADEGLTALHDMGFRLSVDDFGTGYSSLAYLSKMPVDTLKIDRSFVAGLPDAHDSREIVRAVIALARAMRLTVVAEGVETPAQAAFLQDTGCEQAQGYLFARPGSAAQATEFLAESSATATAKVASLAAFRIQSGR